MVIVLFQDEKRIATDIVAVFSDDSAYEICEPALRVEAHNSRCVMITTEDDLCLNKIIDEAV